MTVLDDDDEPKKTPRATIIRRAILVVLALTATGWLLYTRVFVKKVGLGEPCSSNMHCKFEAPKCLKSTANEDGVCSRACVNDGECADGIKCVKVELEEYDERGRPLEGGYCFPQAILDARKKKKDGGQESKRDSWIDVPESPAFEGEVELVHRPGQPNRKDHVEKWLVKGPLTRQVDARPDERDIYDASSMRVFHVNDKQKSFRVSALPGAGPPNPSRPITFAKTERKDRVADHDCEIWTVERDSGPSIANSKNVDHYELCVVQGASFAGEHTPGDPLHGGIPLWTYELATRNAFPLQVLSKSTTVPQLSKDLIATKVDLKKLDPSLFEIPKSYTNAKH